MCRCIDVQFVHGWCPERISTSCRAHRLCRRGAFATTLGFDVPAQRPSSRSTHSAVSALPVRVTPTLGAISFCRVPFSSPRRCKGRDVSPALRSGVCLHSLVSARPGQVESSCFDFEEYLLSGYYQVNIAILRIVESWTLISNDPVFVTVVRQSAAGLPQSFSWKLWLGFLAQDTSKLQVRGCGTNIPHRCRTCCEYESTERTSLRHMCLWSIVCPCWRGADGRPSMLNSYNLSSSVCWWSGPCRGGGCGRGSEPSPLSGGRLRPGWFCVEGCSP